MIYMDVYDYEYDGNIINWNFICVIILGFGVFTTALSVADVVEWWIILIIIACSIPVFGMIFVTLQKIQRKPILIKDKSISEQDELYNNQDCQNINENLIANDDGTGCIRKNKKL